MSERETDPAIALKKIQRIIDSLHLKAVTQHIDCNALVATAKLFDKNQNLIESGAGKGPDSLIGALAESIEHLSMFQFNTDDSSVQSCGFIASQKAAENDGLFTSLPNSLELIKSFKLTTPDQNKELFVPKILLCPRMEGASLSGENTGMYFLSRYSSNSGTAFGCTKPEALLHGINEVIERHILSCFFMAVCSIGPSIKLYTPSKPLLAKALQNNDYALALADKLQIIVIKDVMSVFFSVALPKSGPGHHHLSPIGSGCSLDICTAIRRAVTEQFQVSELYDDAQESIDRTTLSFLASLEKLKPLIDFEAVSTLRLPILDSPLVDFEKSVPAQLESLENSLLRTGKAPYYRTVARYSDDGIVCQSYIPGLERFNLIRNGCHVAPQRFLRQTAKLLNSHEQL